MDNVGPQREEALNEEHRTPNEEPFTQPLSTQVPETPSETQAPNTQELPFTQGVFSPNTQARTQGNSSQGVFSQLPFTQVRTQGNSSQFTQTQGVFSQFTQVQTAPPTQGVFSPLPFTQVQTPIVPLEFLNMGENEAEDSSQEYLTPTKLTRNASNNPQRSPQRTTHASTKPKATKTTKATKQPKKLYRWRPPNEKIMQEIR